MGKYSVNLNEWNIISTILVMVMLLFSTAGFGKTVTSTIIHSEQGAPLFNNLDHYHHPIQTQSPLAQRYFDQGLLLFYGFESGESIRSFRESTRLDPACAMCYWGLALAIGSKMNMPLDGHEHQEAFNAIKKAQELVDPDNQVEKDYITALSQRYAGSFEKNSSEMIEHGASIVSNKEAEAYEKAMHRLVQQYPYDLDAKDLYAYSFFELNKWQFWTRDGKQKVNTSEILKALESVLAVDPHNIAANHFYIHVTEQSPHPENALISADFLRNAVPGSEHLLHMPSHIYILTGRYHDASIANQKALFALKQYQIECQKQGFKPEINYLYQHNLHFLWYAAAMEGRSNLALTTANTLKNSLPAAWLKKDSYLELFLPIPYFAEARFGKWHDILNEPKPRSEFQYTVGLWHYARGIADVNLNKLNDAKNEFFQLEKIAQGGSNIANLPKNQIACMQQNLGKYGSDVLRIAVEVLAATIADKESRSADAITHLKNAIKLQDNMDYAEPPAWYYPVSELLGYELLKQGNVTEAEIAFKHDLHQYPNNGWALFGLEKSLRLQNKNKEAEKINEEFKKAWSRADLKTPIIGIQ